MSKADARRLVLAAAIDRAYLSGAISYDAFCAALSTLACAYRAVTGLNPDGTRCYAVSLAGKRRRSS